MDATEIEQVLIDTLRGLDHPRIREVDSFRNISGNERIGVRVTDSDGSKGFIQVVD